MIMKYKQPYFDLFRLNYSPEGLSLLYRVINSVFSLLRL